MPDATPTTDRPTRFGPILLGGLIAAGVSAVAAAKPWYSASVDPATNPGIRVPDTRADMPAALALSLVVLAAWGVVLVARSTGRRIALTLAVLAGSGVVASAVVAASTLPDQVRERIGVDAPGANVSETAWYPIAAIAAGLGLIFAVVGWWLAPRWPTMSGRYDAPEALGSVLVDETDLWKALDAGVDPTERELSADMLDSTDPAAPTTPGAP